MKTTILFAWAISSFALTAPAILNAQVDVSLVSADAGVQSGKPLTVALHLEQQPGWHTYWVNPGIGEATTLTWTLPPGWKAGPIEWPAPQAIADSSGTVTGTGYEGEEVFLPIVLTPPAGLKPGTTVEFTAHAKWLMCQEQCVPGEEDVHLKLPVVAGAPAPDPMWGSELRDALAALPRADPAWSMKAARSGAAVTLWVAGKAGAKKVSPGDLRFFSTDGLIAYDQPHKITSDGHGGFVLTLPVDPDGPKNATRLSGVLTAANGWHADGSLPGLSVDAPLGAAAK